MCRQIMLTLSTISIRIKAKNTIAMTRCKKSDAIAIIFTPSLDNTKHRRETNAITSLHVFNKITNFDEVFYHARMRSKQKFVQATYIIWL